MSSRRTATNAIPANVLVAVGVVAVVLGGLVAAVTGPLTLLRGSWVAAFLVLPLGVAQVGMGLARRSAPETGAASTWAQLACWNLGGVIVIAGTLTAASLLVDAGSAVLIIALVLGFLGARGWQGWLSVAHRGLLVLLIVSIPVGILLSHLRHG